MSYGKGTKGIDAADRSAVLILDTSRLTPLRTKLCTFRTLERNSQSLLSLISSGPKRAPEVK